MKRRTHYYAIQTADGYVGEFPTKSEAEHERRVRFGVRATAHAIVRVSAKWNPGSAS